MKDHPPAQTEISPAELRLIERLRQHPELMERFQHILEISATEGTVKKADEIEGLLVEELRRLGRVTLESWASRVEGILAEQLKARDPSAAVRKKKR